MQLFGPTPLLTELRPMVWVFIPHRVDSGRLLADSYDTEQTKAELAEAFRALGLAWIWQPVVISALPSVMDQIVACQKRRPTLIFNFCDGVESDGYPGLSVVRAIEGTGIPFTGAGSDFYRVSTSKVSMKERFLMAGVDTPPYEVLPRDQALSGLCARLGKPVMVKPAVSAASYGIGLRSVVSSDQQVAIRRDELVVGELGKYFADSPILAEKFIEGPEFTVLVLGDAQDSSRIVCLPPVERVFHRELVPKERFLSFDRYWGYYREESRLSSDEPFYRYQLAADRIASQLRALAIRAFCAVEGSGYGRVDIRLDAATERLQVLEVNANCGLSSDRETTVGEILRLSGESFADLLAAIAERAIARTRKDSGEQR